MQSAIVGLCLFSFASPMLATARADELGVVFRAPSDVGELSLDATNGATNVLVDPDAATVVQLAGKLLADDIGRVSGAAATLAKEAANLGEHPILIGTIGDGGPVDRAIAVGKVDVDGVRGQWEAFAWQVVSEPMPGVKRALVIVGSDRRGTAYGCTELSRAIGVSPWIWWADVPATHHDHITLTAGRHVSGSPGVKYRGIFINDEDWGFQPWAGKTFDPELGNVGPKTYEKVFELMLRLRLNYLWPAMHPGTREFGEVPGNAEMADRWAIVMGASHCEPMLRNNVYWPKTNGQWRYDTNTKAIHDYWAESIRDRGKYEAVWTTGIRGIHDEPMHGPKEIEARVSMLESIFVDQRQLLSGVTQKFGPVAQCFVPYKEVLPIYDAGLKVPDDITLIWPDDNFGYIRHFPTPAEQKRSGGNGVYYHVSYNGGPQSYLWLESISPGLMWEELHKAWEHNAGKIWVVNVGDIKPAEVSMDFISQLAWLPDRWGADAQSQFLEQFISETFGVDSAPAIVDLLNTYYRLASVRKPDQFQQSWLDTLSPAELKELQRRCVELGEKESTASKLVPKDRADAYVEMIGYPARMLAATGRLFIADGAAREPGHEQELVEAKRQMQYIHDETHHYNEEIGGGKWNRMISDTPHDVAWPTDVGGKRKPTTLPTSRPADRAPVIVDAATFLPSKPAGKSITSTAEASWQPVIGLGQSGRSIAALPTTATHSVSIDCAFDLVTAADASATKIHFLPTLRLDPVGQMRVGVSVDDGTVTNLAVPTADINDEKVGARRSAVMLNRVTIELPAMKLAAGHHVLHITPLDPGVVIDQIELPTGATVK